MKNTSTSHRRTNRALFASLALTMAAMLAGCEPATDSAATATQAGRFPTKADMEAWRVRRDGVVWKTNVFDVQDLKCHTLTDKEKSTEPGGVKAYDEKYLVSVACDYTLVYDRVRNTNAARTESIKRKVVGEEWHIRRTDDPSHQMWQGSRDVPLGEDIN